jgi:hypothetical protein
LSSTLSSSTVFDCIGPRATELARAVARLDASVSVLIAGEAGAGQREVSRRIAAAFYCKEPATGEPCGSCSSCKALANGNAVDILRVEPCGRQELIVVGQVAFNEEHERRKAKDLAPNLPCIREFIGLGPVQGRNKVVLMERVERMNADASNALLKMLEEPPAYARFILTTNAASKVLATIRSRCVLIPCDFETPNEGFAAQLSAGTPELMAQLEADEMSGFVSEFGRFLGELGSRKRSEALKVSEEFQGICALYKKAAADDEDAERFARAEVVRMFANWLASQLCSTNIPSPLALERAVEMHRATLGNVNFGYLCDSFFMCNLSPSSRPGGGGGRG